ncbi:MAG: tetratricopeptide repeat protein [bacterium]|nr:tetratricopeptide repeat protein [bacterium]
MRSSFLRAACLFVSVVLASVVIAQDATPSEEAALNAYRQGEFARAVQLYTAALSETQDAAHKARLHVRIAWTLFALGRESEVETHLRASLVQKPDLTLASDYYTQEFLDRFEEARRKGLESQGTRGQSGAPDLEETLGSVRARLDTGEDLEGALSDVEQLAVAYPSEGRLIPLRIQLLELLGRAEEADQLRQMHLLAGADGEVLEGANLIELLSIPDLILRANRLLDEGDVITSLELLREAVARQPSNVAALELMAEAAGRAAHWQEAEFALKSALGMQPDNIGLKLRLGEVYLAKGDASAARDVFRELTDSHPHSDRAWASLGLLNARLGMPEDASRELKRSLDENPLLPEVQLAYGELLLADTNLSDALEALRAASNLLHEDPQLEARLGQAMVATEKYDDALRLLRAAVSNGFDPPDVKRALVLAMIHLENYSEAGRVLKSLATGRTDHEHALIEGLLAYKKGEFESAESSLSRALSEMPNDPMVLNMMGSALYAQTRYNEALELFEQAQELVPSDPIIEMNRARASAAVSAIDLEGTAIAVKRPTATSGR